MAHAIRRIAGIVISRAGLRFNLGADRPGCARPFTAVIVPSAYSSLLSRRVTLTSPAAR